MKRFKTVLTLFVNVLFLVSVYAEERMPCVMPCLDQVHLSLDQNCEALVTWETILADSSGRCTGPFSVEVQYASSRQPIPTSPMVSANEIGVSLVVVVTDVAGGNNCWGYLVVEDKTDPVISNCDPLFLPCTADISDTATYGITATDACGSVITTYRDSSVAGDCSVDYERLVYRFWKVTDQSGNMATCVQVITLQRPTLSSVIFPPNFDGVDEPPLFCEDKEPDPGNIIETNIGWNALANGHPSPDPEFYNSPNADSVKWFGTGRPLGTCSGIQAQYSDQRIEACTNGVSEGCFDILRRWVLTDWCSGQIMDSIQIIKVMDTLPPEMNGISDITISTDLHRCLSDWDATVPVLIDQCNSNSSHLAYRIVASTGTIRTLPTGGFRIENLPVGTHTVTYTATDCCGNEQDSTIQVTVEDAVPPTAVCDASTQVSLVNDGTAKIFATTFDDISHDNCGPVYFKVIRMSELNGTDHGDIQSQLGTCNGLNADDDNRLLGTQIYFDDFARFCCEDIDSNSIRVVLRVFDRDPGSGPVLPSRMEQGGDLYGHFDDCMVQVTVVDKRAPRITCPGDVTLECTQDFTDLQLTGLPNATDNCSLDTTFYVDSIYLNACNIGTVTRYWTTRDQNGLEATCPQLITLRDTTSPVITFPDDMDVSCGASDDPSETGEPMVMADCERFYVNYTDKVFWFQDSCIRKVLRTWTLQDWCSGEIYTDVQAIKEIDDEAPIFDNIPLDTLVDCHRVPAVPVVTASDACDSDVDILFEEIKTDSICPGTFTLKRFWVATDNCDNITIDSQIIQVVDTLAPTLIGVPGDTTVDCHLIPAAANVTAIDSCDMNPDVSFMQIRRDGSCPDDYILVRIWTGVDNCGNMAVDSQLVTVIDTLAPGFSNVPLDTTLDCSEIFPRVDPVVRDSCDNDPTVTFRQDTTQGSCIGEFTVTRTWIAEDNCGNQDSVKQILSFIDTLPPIISGIPADTTVDCDKIPLPAIANILDSCDPDPEVRVEEARIPGICPSEYTLLRTWIATDSCGNESREQQLLMVIDTIPPVIMGVPSDTTISCDQSFSMPIVTAVDNCDAMVEVIAMQSNPTDSCSGNDATIFTYTATDSCGNTSMAIWRVMLLDTTAPVIIMPTDTIIGCDLLSTVDTATAMDNCSLVNLSFRDEQMAGACVDEPSILRIYTAVDSCGNVARDTQQIQLIDTIPPVFTNVPNDTVITCDSSIPDLQVMAMDLCDDSVEIELIMPDTFIGCNPRVMFTWIATDNCGNQDTVTRFVTLLDTVPPTITGIPNDITVDCDSVVALPDPAPMAIDVCDASPELTFMERRDTLSCIDSVRLVRIWEAMDTCGNTFRDSQIILLVDTLAPIITGVPADTTVECDNIPVPVNTVNATDNCDPLPILNQMDVRVDGDCPGRFTLQRIWTAEDRCGNSLRDTQLIMVIDTTAPIIIGVPNDTAVLCDSIPIIPGGVSADDNCDQATPVLFSEETVDSICSGTFTLLRIWTAIDSCDNITIDTQRIEVLDTIPPVIFVPAPDTMVDCGISLDTLMVDDFRIQDACSKTPVQMEVFEDTISFGCAGTFTLQRIYEFADDCDNISRDTQLIEVIDTIAPTITEPLADTTILCDQVENLEEEPGVEDNCGQEVMIVLTIDTVSQVCTDEYTLLRIWTISDSCDNVARDSQFVMVIDTIAPVFTSVPSDTTLLCSEVPPPLANVMATDNCDTLVDITVVADTTDGPCPDQFTIVRAWTAMDNCGNTTVAMQTISVIDTIPPVLSEAPLDTTVNCDQVPMAPVIGMGITAMDNCDQDVNIVLSQDTIDRECTNGYTIRRIWTAMDNCDNIDRDTQLIMVIDTVAPNLSCELPGFFPQVLISDGSLCDTTIIMNTTLSDNCQDLTGMSFYYEVDFNSDGTIDTFGTIRSPAISYPINIRDSLHTFTLIATDDCDNADTCTVRFPVLDFIGPTTNCTSPVVFLDSSGIGFLLPNQVILQAFDCSSVDSLFFPNLPQDTLFVDCSDLFDPNIDVRIEVTARDTFGNTLPCSPRLIVFDTIGVCGTPALTSVKGQISTTKLEPLSDVEILMNGVYQGTTIANANGQFSFDYVPINTSLEIEPVKNINHRNGVSTFDLVQISKHISGQKPLGSPYLQIAADINKSGHISTFDVVELRKLILYIDTAFTQNTSWRFIRTDYLFPVSDDPFASPFPEVYEIDQLPIDGMHEVDFMGIKIGDINGSARTNLNSPAQTRSIDGVLPLEVVDIKIPERNELIKSIRVAEDIGLLGYQFSLQFDPSTVKWLGLEEKSFSNLKGQNKANFNTDLIEQGILLTSWNQASAVQLTKGTELFAMKFEMESLDNNELAINEDWLSPEVYLSDGRQYTLQINESINSSAKAGYHLYPNRPNPFAQSTVISFDLPKATYIELTIFDASGRTIRQIDGEYAEGYHEFNIQRSELSGGTLFFYQLKTEEFMATRKMVVAR